MNIEETKSSNTIETYELNKQITAKAQIGAIDVNCHILREMVDILLGELSYND